MSVHRLLSRRGMAVLSLLLPLLTGAMPAAAQAWPTKPVRLVVPFPAGGGADVVARTLAQGLSDQWGGAVVVDNKPGGNTILAADAVARSAPDGHTLLFAMDTTLTQNQFLFSKLPYDPVADFTPISMAVSSGVAVVASERFQGGLAEWVARAKASPGQLNYGVSGVSTQVAAALFLEAAGVTAMHVPYKGSAPAALGLVAGDVDLVFDGIAPYLPFVKDGKARVLAVLSAQRSGALPEVPTAAELGWKGLDLKVWFGLAGPKGLSSEVVNRVHRDLVEVLARPEVRHKLGTFAFDPVGSAPKAFEAAIRSDAQRYGPIIRRLGIQLN